MTRRVRCERCTRPESHCLCSLIPALDSNTRVLILQHPDESRHALNTARLAALGLCNAELRVGEVFDLHTLLPRSGYHSCLLFPGPDAHCLGSGSLATSAPLQLVVLDGTWRKARKLLYLNPALAALPRLALAPDAVSRYRLRKAPAEDALSTIEALVQALNIIEAPRCFDALLTPFEALIEGQIRSMGAATYQRNHLRGALSDDSPGSDG